MSHERIAIILLIAVVLGIVFFLGDFKLPFGIVYSDNTPIILQNGQQAVISGQNVGDDSLKAWATTDQCIEVSLSTPSTGAFKAGLCQPCGASVNYIIEIGGSTCQQLKCRYNPSAPECQQPITEPPTVIITQPPLAEPTPTIDVIGAEQKPADMGGLIILALIVIVLGVIWWGVK